MPKDNIDILLMAPPVKMLNVLKKSGAIKFMSLRLFFCFRWCGPLAWNCAQRLG